MSGALPPLYLCNILRGYYGGGYRVLMPNDETEAKMVMDQLKAYRWVDEGTRALFITSYMYAMSLFLQSQIVTLRNHVL